MLLSFGCPATQTTTSQLLTTLLQRTSPASSGGSSPPHQPTGLLGDVVASVRKRPGAQHEFSATGLLGDIVHQGTKRPAASFESQAKLSQNPLSTSASLPQPSMQSLHPHLSAPPPLPSVPAQRGQTHLPLRPLLPKPPLQPRPAELAGSSTQSTTTKPWIPYRGKGRRAGTTNRQVTARPSTGTGDKAGRPTRRPKTPSIPSSGQRELKPTGSTAAQDPWWKVPGGKPRVPMGTGPRYEQRKMYRENLKLKAQGGSGKSTPQGSSSSPKDPHLS
ncbi:unnamed protein product [Sympodiomycopsis kandeliae]